MFQVFPAQHRYPRMEQRDINSNSTEGKFKELSSNRESSVAVRDGVVELKKDELEVVHFTKMF